MRLKKAFSFSLFGDDPKYAWGLLENIRLIKELYPDYDVVAHVEKGHYAYDRVKREATKTIEHEPVSGRIGAFWRFETLSPSYGYDVVCVRDADSRVNVRELAAHNEWLASGKAAHLMFDKASHHRRVVAAGLFSIRVNDTAFPSVDKIYSGNLDGSYGVDENFLAKEFYPLIKDDVLVHDSCGRIPDSLPFPPHPTYNGFVGQIIPAQFDPNNTKFKLISAKRYNSRRGEFFKQLPRDIFCGLHCEVIEGRHYSERVTPPAYRKFMTRVHWWAATRDHVDTLESFIVDDDCDFLFLVEDDCLFSDTFAYDFFKSLCSLPDDWRALRFFWNDNKSTVESVNESINKMTATGAGMLGYFWNKKGALRYFDHIWCRPHLGVDGCMLDLNRYDPVGWYQTSKKLASEKVAFLGRGNDR